VSPRSLQNSYTDNPLRSCAVSRSRHCSRLVIAFSSLTVSVALLSLLVGASNGHIPSQVAALRDLGAFPDDVDVQHVIDLLGLDQPPVDPTTLTLNVQSLALDGTQTTTSYQALDANGNTIANDSSLTFAAGANGPASFAVTTTTTTAASQNLLVQNGTDLTNINVAGASAAQTALTAVNQALSAVTNYAAQIGATQDRMTTANTFNTALMTNYSNGVAGMVDADMNTASTQLQALQTQEQLGIQSLSIANQNAALILKLFQ